MGMAASLQQGSPVLRAGNHFALQAAVAQEVWQPHLRVAHVLAHTHLVRDRHAAGRLSQVEAQAGARRTRRVRVKEKRSIVKRNKVLTENPIKEKTGAAVACGRKGNVSLCQWSPSIYTTSPDPSDCYQLPIKEAGTRCERRQQLVL